MQELIVDWHVLARHGFGIGGRFLLMFVGFGEVFAGQWTIDCLFAAFATAGRTYFFVDSGAESSGFRGLANGAWHVSENNTRNNTRTADTHVRCALV